MRAEGLTDNPVGQPLLVIVLAGRLQGPTRQECGKSPTDQVRDGRSQTEQVEEDEEDEAGSKNLG